MKVKGKVLFRVIMQSPLWAENVQRLELPHDLTKTPRHSALHLAQVTFLSEAISDSYDFFCFFHSHRKFLHHVSINKENCYHRKCLVRLSLLLMRNNSL